MSRYRHPDEYTPSELKTASKSIEGRQTVEEFVRQGGKIKKIPSGVSAYEWRGPAYMVRRK